MRSKMNKKLDQMEEGMRQAKDCSRFLSFA